MLSTRQQALLAAAKAELERGVSTPSGDLLAQNSVTLDEAYTLAEHVALAIEMLLQASEEMRSPLGLVASVGADRIVRAMTA